MSQRLSLVLPEPVPDAMNLQRLKAFEIEERNVKFVTGRIAIENGIEVIPNSAPDTAIVPQGFENHLAQHHRGGGGAVEQVCEMKAERALQLVMIENSGV